MDETLAVSGKLPPAVLPACGADPDRRPDYQMAKSRCHRRRAGRGSRTACRYEDLEGGFFAAERTEDAPDGLENDAVFSFEDPATPLEQERRGHRGGAHVTRESVEAVAGRNIELEADAALAEMREWASLIEEIGAKLLPLANEQADFAETAWREGQSDLQTVLRAREQRLELAGTRLDALREFHLARVRHEAALGNP